MPVTKHNSANVSKVRGEHAPGKVAQDQRIAQTSKRIDAAFVELLHRRAYGNLRVSDISKKAGVGRATFYNHYSSKDDLLHSQFNRVVAPMLAIDPEGACPLNAAAFFAHVLTAPQIYQALLGSSEAGESPRVLRKCFEERIRESLEIQGRPFPHSGTNFEKVVLTRFEAATLLTVVECWVQSGSHQSPQEI